MYNDYLRNWIEENHPEGESPLSYDDWKREVYFSGEPSVEEWESLRSIYHRLVSIAEEIEEIRLSLYTNRAHRILNDEDWKQKDGILFRIQSEIQHNGEKSFGARDLEEWC